MHSNKNEQEILEGLKYEAIRKYKKDTSKNDADIDNSVVTHETNTDCDIIIIKDKDTNILADYIQEKNGELRRLDI